MANVFANGDIGPATNCPLPALRSDWAMTLPFCRMLVSFIHFSYWMWLHMEELELILLSFQMPFLIGLIWRHCLEQNVRYKYLPVCCYRVPECRNWPIHQLTFYKLSSYRADIPPVLTESIYRMKEQASTVHFCVTWASRLTHRNYFCVVSLSHFLCWPLLNAM